jgi:hypothetical protein
MKIRTSLVHLTALCFLACGAVAQNEPPQAHIVSITLDPHSVTVLHLHPGFVSSVRLPEEVSSVVLGDPAAFKGEHSEAEPRLVFFKPASPKPAKSNALISTRSGREVSLTLVSDGAAHSEPVDYVLEYQPQRSFLIPTAYPSVLIGESKTLGDERPVNPKSTPKPGGDERQSPSQQLAAPLDWHGKELRVAVARTEERGSDMTVAFSIANNSPRTVELLPPQVQLSGTAKQQKHHKAIKAEPVAVKDYRLAARRLPPGATTEGTVVFERPAFKESREQLLLQIAQAEEVDRPVLAPIAFVAPAKGAAK